MKLVQVFDSGILGEYEDDLAVIEEISNDTYVRWYPRSQYFDPDLIDSINALLILNGMNIDESDKYFFVLIHFSW